MARFTIVNSYAIPFGLFLASGWGCVGSGLGLPDSAANTGEDPKRFDEIQELIFEEPRAGILALTVLLACVVGPVAEELFFRGLLFSTLRRRMSRPVDSDL